MYLFSFFNYECFALVNLVPQNTQLDKEKRKPKTKADQKHKWQKKCSKLNKNGRAFAD